ncbi:MAG: hypothetical protein WCL08_00645 [Verrucomicrobiota bacterium]
MSTARHLLGAGVIAGVLLSSVPSEAHSSDVLLARLRLQNGPELTLEVTADVQGSSWLRHAPNPVEVLAAGLRVVLPSGRSWSLGELGKPAVTLHQGFAPPAPVPITFEQGEPIPELLTATWVWRPSESPVRIEVPLANPNSVLFWKTEPGIEEPSKGWQILVSGDRSQEVFLPVNPSPLRWDWKAYTALIVAGCGLLLQGALIFLRVRKHVSKPKEPLG